MITAAFISVHIKKSPLAFPLSSALLAASVDGDPLLCKNIKTAVTDFFLDDDISLSAEKIISMNTDIAAFSVYIWNRDYILSLIKKLKQIRPDISVIAGGAEVTADPVFFRNHPDIDWIVNGEGEEAVTEYFRTVVKNLSESEEQNISVSPCTLPYSKPETERISVSDPAIYPSPILVHKICLENYDGILWELSRGCPFKCGFCFESRGSERVRKFPIERITKELDVIKKSGIDQVFVLDPTFNIDRKRAKEILTLIKNKAPDIHFTFEARSEYLDIETAELFSEITCSVQIGLQSSSEDVLKNVNRKLDQDDFYSKVLMLHEAGAVYGFDIIYGLPGDTPEKFLDTVDFALSMAPNHIDIFPLAVLKGTDIYDKADSFGLVYRKSDPYTIIETPGFTAEEIISASETAESINLFYNRGKAVSFLPLLLENTNLSPSDFFTSFSVWLLQNKQFSDFDTVSETEITKLQTVFVKQLFKDMDMEECGILASDIIFSMKEEYREFNENLLSGLFNMDKVFEYLDSGVTDIEELVFFTRT